MGVVRMVVMVFVLPMSFMMFMGAMVMSAMIMIVMLMLFHGKSPF